MLMLVLIVAERAERQGAMQLKTVETVDAGALECRGRVYTAHFVSAANPASVAASDW